MMTRMKIWADDDAIDHSSLLDAFSATASERAASRMAGAARCDAGSPFPRNKRFSASPPGTAAFSRRAGRRRLGQQQAA